jgi:hypothetical protein
LTLELRRLPGFTKDTGSFTLETSAENPVRWHVSKSAGGYLLDCVNYLCDCSNKFAVCREGLHHGANGPEPAH